MAVISLGEGERDAWLVARWAFRGLLEPARRAVTGDSALEFKIDQAGALDGLHFGLMDDQTARRLVAVLIDVADRVVAGEILVRVQGRTLDADSQVQFRNAVSDLRRMLERYGRRWMNG